MTSYRALFVVVLAAACSQALAQTGVNVAQIVAAKNASLNALLARKNGSVAFMRKNATVYVPYLNPNWNPVAGYKKAPLNITIKGRKLSGLPLNFSSGRKLSGLPLNFSSGRKLSGLPLNFSSGRKLSGLPLNFSSGRKLSGLPLNFSSGRKLSGLPLNFSSGRKLMTGINGNSSLIKLAPINITYLHKAMKYPAPEAGASSALSSTGNQGV